MTLGHKVEQLEISNTTCRKGLVPVAIWPIPMLPLLSSVTYFDFTRWGHLSSLYPKKSLLAVFHFGCHLYQHFKCRYGVHIGRLVMVAWIRVILLWSRFQTLRLSCTSQELASKRGTPWVLPKPTLIGHQPTVHFIGQNFLARFLKCVTVHTNCNITLTPVDLKAWNLFEAFDYRLLLPDKIRFRLKKP